MLGFISIAIEVEGFITTIFGPTETANFNVQWQDTETGKYYFENKTEDLAPFKHVIAIHHSSRDMALIFTPTSSFLAETTTEIVTVVMLASFILASLFSILMLSITGLTSQIKSEVKLRTQELEDLNRRLELLSNKDGLTDLFNRRFFEHALQDEFERSRRYKITFTLVMFDIDNFKEINDRYGHPCGDKVIQSIADYLIKTSRSSDVPARIGGEEFALILPRQSEDHVMEIVERIRIDISNIEVKHDESTVQFTCSFGIVIFDENVKDTDMLIKMADQAMYKAKETGKNRTEIFSRN